VIGEHGSPIQIITDGILRFQVIRHDLHIYQIGFEIIFPIQSQFEKDKKQSLVFNGFMLREPNFRMSEVIIRHYVTSKNHFMNVHVTLLASFKPYILVSRIQIINIALTRSCHAFEISKKNM